MLPICISFSSILFSSFCKHSSFLSFSSLSLFLLSFLMLCSWSACSVPFKHARPGTKPCVSSLGVKSVKLPDFDPDLQCAYLQIFVFVFFNFFELMSYLRSVCVVLFISFFKLYLFPLKICVIA